MAKAKAVQLDMLAALTLATPAPDGGDKPRLLDLYCCEGGTALGYIRAGFDVTGVDIEPRLVYPGRFIQADAVAYLAEHGSEYDVVHASPPCQFWSIATPTAARCSYSGPEEFEQVRELCDLYGLPLIMENVVRAAPYLDLMQPLDADGEPLPYERGWRDPIMLCGTMFGLRVLKHRYFEVGGIAVPQPAHPKHMGTVAAGDYVTVAGHGADNARGNFTVASWQEAMGIPHIRDMHSLAEALPPAYTEFLGAYLMAWL